MESSATGRRPACSARLLAVEPQLTLQCGFQITPLKTVPPLAKPNYQYQKRQKELEKKKKQEEKRKRKADSKGEPEAGAEPGVDAEAPAAGEEAPPT